MIYSLKIEKWNDHLALISKKIAIFAPFKEGKYRDFQQVKDNYTGIIYNSPKTLVPMSFFLYPFSEKVTDNPQEKNIILLGAKNCDLAALDLLHKVFLDPDYPDLYFNTRRKNTLIIGTDCYSVDEKCHCTAYNINPFVDSISDLIVNNIDDNILISPVNSRGDEFLRQLRKNTELMEADKKLIQKMQGQRSEIKNKLKRTYNDLPDSVRTLKLISDSVGKKDDVWKSYASDCVSCGACVLSCPTCHCSILIDTPNKNKMEKIRFHDACQYPGFERMAAGVDPLFKHYTRFRNRYMCKFVNRFKKFNALACTGCGRCIETCVGKINKNEVIMDLI